MVNINLYKQRIRLNTAICKDVLYCKALIDKELDKLLSKDSLNSVEVVRYDELMLTKKKLLSNKEIVFNIERILYN